jgi:vitamin B12 transporter
MPKVHLTGAGLAALILANPARAADEATPVSEVIVTATRGADGVEADKVGSSVSVITPTQMSDRQVRIVSDVLRDVPGFAVSRVGAVGAFTQVRVRGTESNHVLTLIDGIEAADPFQGEFDFGTLVSDDVGRIEILRGPQSALYGSDAIAGVINIITPTAAEAPGGRIRVEAGWERGFGGAARWAQVLGPVDYVLNADVQRTAGYVTQTLPGGRRHVGSELESFSGKAGWQVSEALKLKGVVRYTNTHAETNGSSFGRGQVDSPGSYSDTTNLYWLAGADLKLMDGAWTQSVEVQGVDAERNGYGRNLRSSGDEGERTKFSYVTSYRFATGGLTHTLTGALDREKETYQNTSPPSAGADRTKRSIHDTGLVGQYDLQVADRAGIGGAVRHDANDFFADATTWKAQGYVRVSDMIRLRAAAGSGIKNPSQTELFGFNATGPFPFRGNPNLKPEKSRGYEGGVDLSFWDGRVSLGATYFHAKLRDEIFGYFGGPGLPPDCPAPPVGTSTTCNRTFDSTQKGV